MPTKILNSEILTKAPSLPGVEKNNPRIIRGWTMYDWANSVYSLVITTTIFPTYFTAATESAYGSDQITFLGITEQNAIWYSYSLSFSFLVLVFLSPILSGIADYSGRKKMFMQFFAVLGSLSCMSLFFFKGDNVGFGLMCSVLASIGYAGSLVFYNAYLPVIATPDRFDRISARGFALGYIGSVIHMVLMLVLIMLPQLFFDVDVKYQEIISQSPQLSADEAMQQAKDSFAGIASRFAFLTVGLWWIGFATYTFTQLPPERDRKPLSRRILGRGFKELKGVFGLLKDLPHTKKFLGSFFLYNMSVQTVMLLAATFGDKELKLETGFLIQTILVIQIVAIGGAWLFARVSGRRGNVFSLNIMLIIWVGICVGALLVKTPMQFMLLAVVVGLVMGGVQSLSRATYAKLLPPTEDTASFFSFYDVLEKVGVMLGTAIFGLTASLFSSMRFSAIPLMAFFITGLLLLQGLRNVSQLRPQGEAN